MGGKHVSAGLVLVTDATFTGSSRSNVAEFRVPEPGQHRAVQQISEKPPM